MVNYFSTINTSNKNKDEYVFHKMHGLGNDFMILDFSENEKPIPSKKAIRALACRNTGIGFDQLVIVRRNDSLNQLKVITTNNNVRSLGENDPSIKESVKNQSVVYDLLMFNQDGSEVLACGNAYRCIIYYLSKTNHSFMHKKSITLMVEKRQIKGSLLSNDTKEVSVELGQVSLYEDPEFKAKYKNFCTGKPYINNKIMPILGTIGNKHLIIFMQEDFNDNDTLQLEPTDKKNHNKHSIFNYGKVFSEYFKNDINISFVYIINDHEVNIRTLERGAGWTLACGTGAAASIAAANLKGLCTSTTRVNMLGGKLDITCNQDFFITTKGSVNYSFCGVFNLKDYVK